MSLNSAHVPNGGILIHAGECIILFCKAVKLNFEKYGSCASMAGTKEGKLYLTTHRMIFINDKHNDTLLSFSFPFCTLNGVELEQPVFGANYLHGQVRNQPGGGFQADATFKLVFKNGGCVEFGQAMITAARMANRHTQQGYAPPPYTPHGQDNYYPAPPPAYTPHQQEYNGWVPPYSTFPDRPHGNTVYVHDLPPPYPGIIGFVNPTAGQGVPYGAPGGAPSAPHYQPPPQQPPVGFYNANQQHQAYMPAAAAAYPNVPPPSYREKSD